MLDCWGRTHDSYPIVQGLLRQRICASWWLTFPLRRWILSFFTGVAGHWRLGVCTDRKVEDSWSDENLTTRFASSLASSDRDGTKGKLWGQKELLVQAMKTQRRVGRAR